MEGLRRLLIRVVAVALVVGSVWPAVNLEDLSAQSPPVFEEVADAAGLHYRDETCGFAWGDYDDDGDLDLFLGHHPALTEPDPDRESWLMANNGDGTFTNVIHGSGILLVEDRHDASWIDFDRDGDLDLWVSIGGRGGQGEGPSQLYRNDGGGKFVDVAPAVGVDYPLGRGRGSAWLDYDLDGDLDLYFAGAEREEAGNAFFRQNADGTFSNITAQLGLDPFTGPMPNVAVGDYDGDGDQDLFVTGLATRLYRNDGSGFVDVSASTGARSSAATSAAWGDYDNDGDLDLYVARGDQEPSYDFHEYVEGEVRFVGRVEDPDTEDGLDFEVSPDATLTFYLQVRIGGGVFRDTAYIHLGQDKVRPATNPFTVSGDEVVGVPSYSAGVDRGFYIWQSEPGHWHLRWSGVLADAPEAYSGIITASEPVSGLEGVGYEPWSHTAMADQLFRNNGDGTFSDVTAQAGLGSGDLCRSPAWGDFDNDGDLDLYVQTVGDMGADKPNLLYRNNGDGTFSEIAAQAGVEGSTEGFGWGAVWADYDNDGYLDLLANQESWWWPLDRGRYELFRNPGGSNHWLKLDLRGVQSNARGQGAKVRVVAGGRTLVREVTDSSHYFQHYNGPLHVGLGTAQVAEEVRIEWPSGVVQVLENVAADQQLQVVEGASEPTPTPTTPTDPTPTDTTEPTPTDVPTATLYEHLNQGDDGSIRVDADMVVGQSFTPSESHTVNMVRLKLYRQGSPGPATVTIRAAGANGLPTGTELTAGVLDTSAVTTSTGGEWYSVALTPVELQADTQYVLSIALPGGNTTNRLFWRWDRTSPPYAGGAAVYSWDGGTSWRPMSGNDMMFEEWGGTGAVPTDTPTTEPTGPTPTDTSTTEPTPTYTPTTEPTQSPDLVLYARLSEGDDGSIRADGTQVPGQSFTPAQTHTVSQVRLKLYRQGSPGLATVAIRAADSRGMPTGSPLTTGTLDTSAITTSTSGEWYSVDLSPAELQADTQYVITIDVPDGDASNRLFARWDRSNPPYAGGTALYSWDGGVSWRTVAASDLVFEEWGGTGAVPTSTPTTEPTPTDTPTTEPTPTDTPTTEPTPTDTPTTEATPTDTPTTEPTPTDTPTTEPTPTDTPTTEPTPTDTPTTEPTPTDTPTTEPTATVEPTPTDTPPPPSPPQTGEVTPNQGSSAVSTTVVFTTTYRDVNGWQDIHSALFLVNVQRRFQQGLFGGYYVGSNTLMLRDDAGSNWVGSCTPGEAKTLSNSYVSLDCAGSSVAGEGDTLTVNWRVTPLASFSNQYTTYAVNLLVRDNSGAQDGWDEVGSWTLTE